MENNRMEEIRIEWNEIEWKYNIMEEILIE